MYKRQLFWLVAALLGQDTLRLGGGTFLLWIACVFVSVVVHEFGHALTARYFGADPSVLLYGMGGLCVYREQQTRPQRLVVLLMGPGAGFLLLALVVVLTTTACGISIGDFWNLRFRSARMVPPVPVIFAAHFLAQINLIWGLFNLLPIMPLDGGQVAEILLNFHNRAHGTRRAYILSILTAGLAAIFCVRMQSYWNAVLLGLLALNSYQVLQTLHYQAKYGDSFYDDADWWKR